MEEESVTHRRMTADDERTGESERDRTEPVRYLVAHPTNRKWVKTPHNPTYNWDVGRLNPLTIGVSSPT